MKESYKNKILIIFINILIIAISYYGRIYIEGYNDLKSRMYYDLLDFGSVLENFNEEITEILVLEDYTYVPEKEFINIDAIHNLRKSYYDATDMTKNKILYEYENVYLNANTNIKNILLDKSLSASEKEYLQAVFLFNNELIKEHESIFGELKDKWDYEKMKKLRKKIPSLYTNYFIKVDELLNTPTYAFLKDYEGDFEEVDFDEVKTYCDEVFSKLVSDQPLEYNNKEDKYADRYIFRTYEEGNTKPNLINQEIDYIVEYDKKTKQVTVRAVNFMIPSGKYKQNELDKIAKDTIALFDRNLSLYHKEIQHYSDGEMGGIIYSYIENHNGIYDEMKKITFELEVHGLVSNLTIMYPYLEPIKIPAIASEEVLEKIDQEAEILNVLTIRSTEGDTEYEVHLKYKDAYYAAVFNAESGKIKYFGRDMRTYNQ